MDERSCILFTKVLTVSLLRFRPHRLHAVHRCGLLLQMSHVAWSVCMFMLVTQVSCVKTAEPIEMPFGRLTQVGLRNILLDWVQIPTWMDTFEGDVWQDGDV